MVIIFYSSIFTSVSRKKLMRCVILFPHLWDESTAHPWFTVVPEAWLINLLTLSFNRSALCCMRSVSPSSSVSYSDPEDWARATSWSISSHAASWIPNTKSCSLYWSLHCTNYNSRRWWRRYMSRTLTGHWNSEQYMSWYSLVDWQTGFLHRIQVTAVLIGPCAPYQQFSTLR